MPCYRPIPATLREWTRINGETKKRLDFKNPGPQGFDMQIACGQCIGCRIDKKLEWATRCMHETKMWEQNCFVNLTYEDEYLPEDGSLKHRDFQLFMKRLRKEIEPIKTRFFMCGEYGPTTDRPHYHSILFNYDFPDKKFWKNNEQGDPLFTSEQLSETWSLGFCSLGAVTPQSASYVAGYVEKKMTGEAAERKYGKRCPEYGTASNRPGIGKAFWENNISDIYPDDFTLLGGKKRSVPRYYDKLLEREEPEIMEMIKETRKERNKDEAWEGERSSRRLKIREKCAKARTALKKPEVL